MNKLIRLKEVMALTGLSRSSIYQFISEGKFPSQVQIGVRAVAWPEREIQQWIERKMVASRAGMAAA